MTHKLIEMLRYMRPEGSETQKEFCDVYLKPIFGSPDIYGNYILNMGVNPRLCFTAHHDTVHKTDGIQNLLVSNEVVSVADPISSSCLGADCTTGIWLMLNMIEAGVEGTYVVHAAEEIGCKGSIGLVYDNPYWLDHTEAVISFDRKGTDSVITHQMGMRTASDAFANSFADALNLPQLKPDAYGSYTDSNEYCRIIQECTNISVGYYNQHSSKETQDLKYAEVLLDHLIKADWSKIIIERDPSVLDDDWNFHYEDVGSSRGYYGHQVSDITTIVDENPDGVASLLESLGFSADTLLQELDIRDNFYLDNYGQRRMM